MQYKTYAVRLLQFVVGENAVRLYRFITDNDAVQLLQFTLRGDAVSMQCFGSTILNTLQFA